MSMLPDFYFDAVVSLEQEVTDIDDEGSSFTTMGSGVLLGHQAQGVGEDGELRETHIYLATNRHIVEDQDVVYAKFNVGADAPAERLELMLEDDAGEPLWFTHDEYDVAVTYLSASGLADVGVSIAPIPEAKWLDVEEMEDAEIGAGDEVFVLGFPLGLAGRERKYVIVRAGIIARVDDELVTETNGYLIDCSIFPGNSGGPVFRKPVAFITTEGEEPELAWYPPDFLGIVSKYLSYEDVAVSMQTGNPRVIFEENSGLASVVPVNAIREAIEHHEEYERDALESLRAQDAEASHEAREGRLEPPQNDLS